MFMACSNYTCCIQFLLSMCWTWVSPTTAGTPSLSVSFVSFLVLFYRGYSLEELDKHISLLHEYNEIKDAGQMLLGKLGKEGKAVKDLFSQCFHTDTERSCCHRGKACVTDSSLKKKCLGKQEGQLQNLGFLGCGMRYGIMRGGKHVSDSSDLCLMKAMLFLYFLAVIRGVTTKQLYPEYDLELSD